MNPYRFVILCLFAAASALAWLTPGSKANTVFGRLNYSQFWLAIFLTLATISSVAVALGGKARALKISAVWLGLLAAILITELLAWSWPARHQMDNPWYIDAGGGTTDSIELPFERPPHLKWRGLSRGDLAFMNHDDDPYARTITFETDFEGFHNAKDIRQADLVMIGDSYTEAGNIPEDENFTSLASRKLGLSARNLGRAGYTTPTELIVLKKYGLPCRPKFIVWQIAESNDLAECIAYENWIAKGRGPYFQTIFRNSSAGIPSASERWQRRSPTYNLFTALRHHDLNPWPFTGTFTDRQQNEIPIRFALEFGLQQPARGHRGWPTFSTALAEGAEICRTNNIHLLVVLIPMKYRALGPYTHFPPGVRERAEAFPGASQEDSLGPLLQLFCDAHKIPFADATPILREKAKAGDLVYLPFDTHLSPAGHQAVAELITDKLKQTLP
ncbi:MAG: hypothetical protein C5B50_07705 [Verrucomicrobia bacterium]|nr:MAG: hypothetical protein C5B50_07705 [Verrucomicrobiota bacterium]